MAKFILEDETPARQHRPRLAELLSTTIGSSHAVVTSANLTGNAFDSNIEVGVTIAGSDTKRLSDWFDGLWDVATPLTTDDLTDLAGRAG